MNDPGKGLRARRAAVSLFAVGLAFVAPAPAAVTKATGRAAAPDFVREDSSGARLRLADLKGRVVLLNFWATWCRGCQEEIPWFAEFERAHGPKGLTVVGASVDEEGWDAVRPYLAKKRLPYPIVLAGDDMTRDYKLQNLPVTVLIDREGRIATTVDGMVDRKGCESDILALLGEPPPSAGD